MSYRHRKSQPPPPPLPPESITSWDQVLRAASHPTEPCYTHPTMTLKNGIDLIEIERIQAALQRHGQRFLERVFTPHEIRECRGRPDALALRFAAKEATVKALGTGIGPVSWLEVETLHHPSGEPYLVLHGNALKVANALGLTQWAVSLTHSRDLAAAVVTASSN